MKTKEEEYKEALREIEKIADKGIGKVVDKHKVFPIPEDYLNLQYAWQQLDRIRAIVTKII